MSKVLYSATMSLDGYIAGPGGDMSWLRPYLRPNPPIEELQKDIGALVVGGRTHRGDDPHRGTEREGVFEGTLGGPVFVIRQWLPGPLAAPSEQGWREAFAKLDAALAGAGAARFEV